MTTLRVLICGALLAALPVMAQTTAAATAAPAPEQPTNYVAGGISYLPGGSPAIAGTGIYAHQVSGGMYAFVVADALPQTVRPFTVTSQVATGVAAKIFTIGKTPIFVPTAAGISWNGTNTGWAWSTGGMASIAVKAGSPFRVMPAVRIVKSSVSGGSGYGFIAGVYLGWGF